MLVRGQCCGLPGPRLRYPLCLDGLGPKRVLFFGCSFVNLCISLMVGSRYSGLFIARSDDRLSVQTTNSPFLLVAKRQASNIAVASATNIEL